MHLGKRVITFFVLFILTLEAFSPFGLAVKQAKAQVTTVPASSMAATAALLAAKSLFMTIGSVQGMLGPVPFAASLVGPLANTWLQMAQMSQAAGIKAGEAVEKKQEAVTKNVWALAFKNALRFMFRTFAYDVATWIASGDTGEQPLFYTQGWGAYLQDIADAAGGEFIQTLGEEWTVEEEVWTGETEKAVDHDTGKIYDRKIMAKKPVKLGLNLCRPSLAARLHIMLGLTEYQRPRRPDCTVMEMVKNWQEAITKPDFHRFFQDMFQPWGNELGIALSVQTGLSEHVDRRAEQAIKERLEGWGFKSVTDKISGYIKTPAKMVFGVAEDAMEKADTPEKIFTATAADFLDVFVNTLLGKLFQKWIIGGMAGKYNELRQGTSGAYLTGYYGGLTGGVAAARETYASLAEPSFREPGEYEILGKLTICPDSNNPGPTDCVISEKFRSAIENHLTVRSAIAGGYLDDRLPFGFLANGLEPDYRQGYPYRSLVILRKHRILPVGFELAALYLKNWGASASLPMTLKDVLAAYDNPSSPLYRLVDPDWVLKAPASSCRREGPGQIILSSTTSSGVDANGDGDFTDSGDRLPFKIIQRASSCADEQSCIEENPDGSCRHWGYCMEEKRIWKFVGEACRDYFASCEVVNNREGKKIGFLKNTLDWGNCNAGNVGCIPYSRTKNSNGKWIAFQSTANLTAAALACSREEAGCAEFIKTGPGLGTNLFQNPSFERYEAGLPGTLVNNAYEGSRALKLTNTFSQLVAAGLPIANRNFTFSFYAKDCVSSDTFGFVGGRQGQLRSGGEWRRYVVSYTFPGTAAQSSVPVQISSGSCVVDALKLEEAGLKNNGTASPYSAYGQTNLTYLKKAPEYLGCYGANSVSTSPSAECNKYALSCGPEEVGCEKYTPSSGGYFIPAVGQEIDRCPAACIGYATFNQVATSFETAKYPIYFIPTTGRSCGSESAGCDQFTNLDKVARGGEDIEYYTALRQCEKPGPATRTFYTWEGSDETGFQLKSWSLIKGGDNGPACAGLLSACTGPRVCDSTLFQAGTNPDCREFYDATGQNAHIFYRLVSKTIVSSEACISLRKTESDETSCVATGGRWSPPGQAGFCVYFGLPQESRACGKEALGCREYTGSAGGNISRLFFDNFETTPISPPWSPGASLSAESITLGGRSLSVASGSGIKRELKKQNANGSFESMLLPGQTYALSFWAKGGGNITVSLQGAGESLISLGRVALSNAQWGSYELGPVTLPQNLSPFVPSAPPSLSFTGFSKDSFLDTIIFSQVREHFFIIKNSWRTPSVCDQTLEGAPFPQANLGCREYTSSQGDANYFKSFSRLCRERSAGCAVFIDTKNHPSPLSVAIPGYPEATIPADSFSLLVDDEAKLCSASGKSCEALGLPRRRQDNNIDETGWETRYLKNDPSRYPDILCHSTEAFCEQYTNENGAIYYFKDPGLRACEFKQLSGQNNPGWYKVGTNTGAPNCPVGDRGILSGSGARQPVNDTAGNFVGLCPESQSGCTEFFDPKSSIAKNLVLNGGFETNINNPFVPDGWVVTPPSAWSASSPKITNGLASQNIILERGVTYVIAGEASRGTATLKISNCGAISSPDNSMNSTGGSVSLAISAPSSPTRFSGRFKAQGGTCFLEVSVNNGSLDAISLRKVGVYYAFNSSVSGAACNGTVNEKQGCVLLNRRAVGANGALPYLSFDADLDRNGQAPSSGPTNDANVILKAEPDRTCGTWLACRAALSTKDKEGQIKNLCLSLGACTSLNEQGECDGFPSEEQKDLTFATSERDKLQDLSGYVKAGLNFGGGQTIQGLLPFSRMEQRGTFVTLKNPSFEKFYADGKPADWFVGNYASTWLPGLFRVIADPFEVEKLGTKVPEGRAFLEVRRTAWAETPYLETFGPGPYIISSYLNTIGLDKGEGYIEVYQYRADRTLITPTRTAPNPVKVSALNAGLDWTFKVARMALNPDTRFIKLHLGGFYNSSGAGVNEARGSTYFDYIRVEPALEVQTLPFFTPKTCRLYPQTDSPSCEYQDEGGTRERGLYGYCLETDPRNPNVCLTWWPVDIIQGETLGEIDRSYKGKAPLYYCAEAEVWKKKPAGEIVAGACDRGLELNAPCGNPQGVWPTYAQNAARCDNNPNVFCAPDQREAPPGYTCRLIPCSRNSHCEFRCTASDTPYYVDQNNNAWYRSFDNNPPVRFTVPGSEFQEEIKGVCTKLTKTVQSDGTNSAWLSNLEGGYIIPDLGFTLGYDAAPYGSVTIPASGASDDPGTWDISAPLTVEPPGNVARAGAPYACLSANCSSQLKIYPSSRTQNINFPLVGSGKDCTFTKNRLNRLFAQNYGTWEWKTSGHYEQKQLSECDWAAPSNLCSPPTSRPQSYPNDYCVVAPYVSSIRVNNKTSDKEIVHGAGFVALKFNSIIDSEQLPMVAYFVDWGDGLTTAVTGAEMQNRPNPENPHTLYRHVSFWDLKQRQQAGVATIICDSESCRVRPKIQIRDKWGWCNGETPTQAFFSSQCLTVPSAWAASPVEIEVRRE